MRGPCALAGIAFGAAMALATGFASAQVPYQIGDNRGGVTVDLGVMENLGPTPTVPQMLRPGTPVGEIGYDARRGAITGFDGSSGAHAAYGRGLGSAAPALGVDSAPAPDWLRRPDAPQYAPLPDTLTRRPTASRPVASTAPTLTRPTAPPAPTRSAPERTSVAAVAPQVTSKEWTQSAPSVTARIVTPTPSAAPAARTAAPVSKAPEPPRAPPPPQTPKPAASAAVAAPPPPKAPPPAAAPVAAPPPPPKSEPNTRVAAATTGPAPAPSAPSSQGTPGDMVRVPFSAGQSTLPDEAKATLDTVVARLRKDETQRIQLLAYADGDEDNANKARRLSLSRALAVRAYLIDKQVQSTRMDVRALGNRAKDSPKDRVDVVLVAR